MKERRNGPEIGIDPNMLIMGLVFAIIALVKFYQKVTSYLDKGQVKKHQEKKPPFKEFEIKEKAELLFGKEGKLASIQGHLRDLDVENITKKIIHSKELEALTIGKHVLLDNKYPYPYNHTKFMLLLEAVKQNTSIISLTLEGNNIGIEGASLLAEFLQKNTSLVSLNVKNVDNFGVEVLCNALKQHPTLAFLTLAGKTYYECSASNAIAELIKNNPTITFLDITDITLDAKKLAAALKVNHSLKHLGLHGCMKGVYPDVGYIR